MLRNRPAAFLCLVFSAGVAAGLFYEYRAALVFAAATALAFLFRRLAAARFSKHRALSGGSDSYSGRGILPRAFKSRALAVILSFAALFFGALYSALYISLQSVPKPEKGEVCEFDAAVRSVAVYADSVSVQLDIQDPSSPFDGHRAYLYLKGNPPEQGCLVRLKASLAESSRRAKSNGVDYIAYGSFTKLKNRQPKGLYYAVLRLRRGMGRAADRAFRDGPAGFYKALLTGDRSGLSAETAASFTRSGILHIMAISGQHFSLVIVGLYGLLMSVFRRKRVCSAVCIFAAFAYALFTGFTPSVTRAALMCCAVFAANLLRERSDSLITLSVVLAVILLFRPYAIVNVSLQLSFLATYGIILTLGYLEGFYDRHRVRKLFRPLISSTALSVSAALFCMPVYLFSFDYASLCSPLTNIAAGALVGPSMLTGALALLLKPLGLGFFARVPEFLYFLLRSVSDFLGGFRFSCVALSVPHIKLLLLPSLAAVAAYSFFRFRKGLPVLVGAAAASGLICFSCLGLLQMGYKDNALVCLTERSGSCAVFYADHRSAVLIDGGGADSAASAATDNGCAYLDAYVVTECSANALSRLRRTLPVLPAETVYLPESESADAKRILKLCEKSGSKTRLYDAEKGLSLKNVRLYGSRGTEAESQFLLRGEKFGASFSLFGAGTDIQAEACGEKDALVISRACTNAPCDTELLPFSCEKCMVFKGDKSFLTSFLLSQLPESEMLFYKNTLLLRFGKAGVSEVTDCE